MKRHRWAVFLAVFVVLVVVDKFTYEGEVNVDWMVSTRVGEDTGFFYAVGRLWSRRDLPAGNRGTDWVPLFLVVSDTVRDEKEAGAGGYGTSIGDFQKIGFRYAGTWIDVPVSPSVPVFGEPKTPDAPNVFILRSDHSLEPTGMTIRTREQADAIHHLVKGPTGFSQVEERLRKHLANNPGEEDGGGAVTLFP